MQNLSNINPDDISRIVGFDRRYITKYQVEDTILDMYIIKFTYDDKTTRFIRVFCVDGTSQKLPDDARKKKFFIERLFGEDGLIVKQGRNDYVYLGMVYDGVKVTRFNKNNHGRTIQEEFDKYFRENVMPRLNLSTNYQYDPIDMEYHFHVGNEDEKEVFSHGLLNSHGGAYGPSFHSTFYPADGRYTIFNNLADAARKYGIDTGGKKVFITQIPRIYRGIKTTGGSFFPPIPIMKMIDVSQELSYIIPNVIYGMYDMETGVLHLNPNYQPKFNPDGLTYDNETINKIRNCGDYDLADFMLSRMGHTYQELLMHDKNAGTFAKYCQFYGIEENQSHGHNPGNHQ